MLIGSFEHMLDAKGRVFIPAKWREARVFMVGMKTKLLYSSATLFMGRNFGVPNSIRK